MWKLKLSILIVAVKSFGLDSVWDSEFELCLGPYVMFSLKNQAFTAMIRIGIYHLQKQNLIKFNKQGVKMSVM